MMREYERKGPCMQTCDEKAFKRGRLLYIFHAAVEYLIALAVSGSFLAKLTAEIGMRDGMTGVIAAVGTLGGLFQLISMFIHKNRVKKFVLALTAANQLLFISLYLIPQLALGQQVSGVLFTTSIVMANLLINVAAPKKSTWMMSLVDDRKRGDYLTRKAHIKGDKCQSKTYKKLTERLYDLRNCSRQHLAEPLKISSVRAGYAY